MRFVGVSIHDGAEALLTNEQRRIDDGEQIENCDVTFYA